MAKNVRNTILFQLLHQRMQGITIKITIQFLLYLPCTATSIYENQLMTVRVMYLRSSVEDDVEMKVLTGGKKKLPCSRAGSWPFRYHWCSVNWYQPPITEPFCPPLCTSHATSHVFTLRKLSTALLENDYSPSCRQHSQISHRRPREVHESAWSFDILMQPFPPYFLFTGMNWSLCNYCRTY